MKTLPERSDLDHLRKQARTLLRAHRRAEPDALARLQQHLPAAHGRTPEQIAAMPLRLHDAQSCLAREYGYRSWSELKAAVDWRPREDGDRNALRRVWLGLVYAGDVTGDTFGARPLLAQRLLAEHPDLPGDDPWLACALGEETAIRRALADPGWVAQPGGPLRLPPLVALMHSSLSRIHAARFRACARRLLEAGADPNQSIGNRWPPHSLAEPGDDRLSALYGAVAQSRDAQIVRLLLDAGADPNDNESLYHAVESPDCLRVLLEHGTRIAGTNALAHAIAQAQLTSTQLLLDHGADPNQITAQGITPLATVIRLRRPAVFAQALLAAGADPQHRGADGRTPFETALSAGLVEIAALLGDPQSTVLNDEDAFVAACARADGTAAREVLGRRPDLFSTLGPARLRHLPELAMNACDAAVRLMVTLGWPVATRGGDEPFSGSALNWAVFRGDAALAAFLLGHGAHWSERHGYGSNVIGTLSWASCNTPPGVGDWLGCAQALVAHGLPRATLAEGSRIDDVTPWLVIDGETFEFAEDVTGLLLDASTA